MTFFQKILISLYTVVNASGLLQNRALQRLVTPAYFAYKKWYEDPFAKLIRRRPDVFQGGHILDIGACIGYTSILYAKVISSGFSVYAFEPDLPNFQWLQETIRWYHAEEVVIPIQAAVGATQGVIELWHNERSFGDHRINTQTFQKSGINVQTIKMWDVDSFVNTKKIATSIRLIKIDVQGYELAVCQGMESTLHANPDMIVAVEYSPDAIRELGFEPQELLNFFREKGYILYILHRQNGKLERATDAAIENAVNQISYIDMVCSQKELLMIQI